MTARDVSVVHREKWHWTVSSETCILNLCLHRISNQFANPLASFHLMSLCDQRGCVVMGPANLTWLKQRQTHCVWLTIMWSDYIREPATTFSVSVWGLYVTNNRNWLWPCEATKKNMGKIEGKVEEPGLGRHWYKTAQGVLWVPRPHRHFLSVVGGVSGLQHFWPLCPAPDSNSTETIWLDKLGSHDQLLLEMGEVSRMLSQFHNSIG